MEASFFDERSMYQIYFNVEPGFGYYLPENASVKVIRPAGYGSGTVHDPITYSTLYKDDWIEESSISRKYRTERGLEPTSQLKEYGTDIRIQEPKVGGPDHKPMGTYDKFEVGKDYFLELRIGFEGGEELGHVYPKELGRIQDKRKVRKLMDG